MRATASPPGPATAALPYWSSICTVIVPEAAPAAIVCIAVVNSSLLAGAGFTVSCWVAERRPAAEAVSVGVPASVSSYTKLAELLPEGTVMRVTRRPPLKNSPTPEVVVRLICSPPAPAVTGLPRELSNCTVVRPTGTPAVRVRVVAKASFAGGATCTVSCWVAGVRLPAAAVIVGVPPRVSRYSKLAARAGGNRDAGDRIAAEVEERSAPRSGAEQRRHACAGDGRVAVGVVQLHGDGAGGHAGGERLRRRGDRPACWGPPP